MQAVAANALPTKVGVTHHMKYTYWNNNKNKNREEDEEVDEEVEEVEENETEARMLVRIEK